MAAGRAGTLGATGSGRSGIEGDDAISMRWILMAGSGMGRAGALGAAERWTTGNAGGI
jgi:hypothetical protein